MSKNENGLEVRSVWIIFKLGTYRNARLNFITFTALHCVRNLYLVRLPSIPRTKKLVRWWMYIFFVFWKRFWFSRHTRRPTIIWMLVQVRRPHVLYTMHVSHPRCGCTHSHYYCCIGRHRMHQTKAKTEYENWIRNLHKRILVYGGYIV